MYDRDTVELFLMALDEGMNVARAGREVGIPEDTARRWAAGDLRTATRAGPGPRVESRAAQSRQRGGSPCPKRAPTTRRSPDRWRA